MRASRSSDYIVDTEQTLQLVFLASVEKGFTPEVGHRLLDAVKAKFVAAFDPETVRHARVLGLSASFAAELEALHVFAAHQAHFSANYDDRLESAMALRQALKEQQGQPEDRGGKADPLLDKLTLMNQFEDFIPSYKKSDDSQGTESLSDQAIGKSRYAIVPHKEGRLVIARRWRVSRRAKRLLFAAALVVPGDQLLTLVGIAGCVCCFAFEVCRLHT